MEVVSTQKGEKAVGEGIVEVPHTGADTERQAAQRKEAVEEKAVGKLLRAVHKALV